MQQLNLRELIINSFDVMKSSKVFMLFVLEFLILIVWYLFRKLMDKKVVNKTCLISSIIVFGFYLCNYYKTLVIFIDNVSTKFIEFIYFPTTLQYVVIMGTSIVVMFLTYITHRNKLLKVINTIIPIGISYLFFSIIEYINDNKLDFNEFTVFTDPFLTSMYEIAMIVFIVWIVGLVIYKIDIFIINRVNHEGLVKIDLNKFNDDIELPRLKSSKI